MPKNLVMQNTNTIRQKELLFGITKKLHNHKHRIFSFLEYGFFFSEVKKIFFITVNVIIIEICENTSLFECFEVEARQLPL